MMFSRLDTFSERMTRRVASATSRRSVLARVGQWAVAAPLLPLLPVVREARADSAGTPIKQKASDITDFAAKAQTKDPGQCNYWRHCAIDGYLCTCCGGGIHTCPPGSSPSPTSWIGTCLNPDDGKSYLVAYRDCCGLDGCGQCNCIGTDGEQPAYRPQTNNDIIWCFGAQQSMMYHCSTAALIGLAG